MPLNIKNIFSSDLDPNRTDFWSTDKLDKLNYNFKKYLNNTLSENEFNESINNILNIAMKFKKAVLLLIV